MSSADVLYQVTMNIHRALAILYAGSLFAQAPTFTKDVAPILQARCQVCHRPGEAAPFSLFTYEQARPWAKAIKEAVLARKMPPWFADPHYGKFANDSSLTQHEIDTLRAWVDGGAQQGNPKDLPPPREFADGWAIPKPDAVIELPTAFEIPATGTLEYQHILIPAPFKTDQWVQFAEARPTDRTHVHHIIAFIREPGSDWLKDAKPGIPFVPEKVKDEQGGHQPASQRFSGGLRSRPAAGEVRAGAGQTNPGRFRHHSCRCTTPPTGSRVRTAAASAWSSPRSRRGSASSPYRRPTASSRSRPAHPTIRWMRSSNWAPT